MKGKRDSERRREKGGIIVRVKRESRKNSDGEKKENPVDGRREAEMSMAALPLSRRTRGGDSGSF